MIRTARWLAAAVVLLTGQLALAAPLTELADLIGAWSAPSGTVAEIAPTPDMTTVTLHRGSDQVRVLLAPLPPQLQPGQGTPLTSLVWLTDPRQPDPQWQPALDSLRAHIARADHGQFAQTHVPGQAPPQLLLTVTWVLLALSVVALPWALRAAWIQLPGNRRWWAVALALAWLVRAWVPHRLVMVHFGYLHVDQARTLGELPRYGSATTLLDHALFWLAPANHASVQWMHTVLGTLTIVPLAALAQRMAGATAAVWTALMVAVLPLAWLDHGSESMLVPAMLWWAAATVALVAWAQQPRWVALAAAIVLLALCGLSRPDCLLVGGPTALLVAEAAAPGSLLKNWRTLVLAVVVLAVVCLPDALYLRERTAQDVVQGNLPRLNASFLAELPQRLLRGWVVLDPRYFALPLLVLAAAGLGMGAVRRRVALLWLAALLWAVPMLLDFNESSKLRLHMPSALLVVVAAAVGLAAWLAALRPESRRNVLVVLVPVTVLAILATAPRVLAPQISDASATAIAEAVALATDNHPTALVVRAYGDAPSQGVHLYWPDYALEPGDRWLSVADWQAGRLAPGERALGLIDVRCWAKLPDHHFAGVLHPACLALQEAAVGTPLWQESVGNVGERGFAWYPPAAILPELVQSVVSLSR